MALFGNSRQGVYHATIGGGVMKKASSYQDKHKRLNQRQKDALNMMLNKKMEMTNNRYRKMFGVSQSTAYRDLNKLLRTGLVKARGRFKDRVYFIQRGGENER